MYIGVKYWYRL